MNDTLTTRRIWIFLAFTFGLAWLTGLVIYLTGGLAKSPLIAPRLTLALVLMATTYMWAPALANIFTRLITREGWGKTLLPVRAQRAWPYWLAAWFLPGLLVILGGAVFFVIFPRYFDPALGQLRAALQAAGRTLPPSLWTVVLTQTALALVASPVLNAIATFGEEFGWRAYLLPKLIPPGSGIGGVRRAVVLLGIIWGVWHWPVIFMGYEYGFNYPGYPWLGPLLFIWFTFTFGVFQAWVTIRSGSVWPAVIGHGAINGIAQLPLLLLKGTPNPLIGPFVIGIVGGIGISALALLLFFLPGPLRPAPPVVDEPPAPEAQPVIEA